MEIIATIDLRIYDGYVRIATFNSQLHEGKTSENRNKAIEGSSPYLPVGNVAQW